MRREQAKALETALDLELPVFPVFIDREGNKRPACRWRPGASDDPVEIAAMWDAHPAPLIGVPMGAASRLLALDLDTARHDEAIDWLDENHHRLPETQTHITKSGGAHYLYRWREGLGNTSSRLAIGIDTRGEGGFIVWWPAAGFPIYREGQIAEIPDWLAEALKPKPIALPRIAHQSQRHADAGIDGVVRKAANAQEGERASLLYWAALRLRERAAAGQITAGFAARLLLRAGLHAGLTEREAQGHIRNGLLGGTS